MNSKPFSLSTRAEVVAFEEKMYLYSKATTLVPESHISLVNAWDKLADRTDRAKVFSALLDVHLSVHFVLMDILSTIAIWNNCFSPGNLEGGTILDSTEKYFGKMDIHRFSTSFVLRYRAAWDKILGLFVLLESPESYEKFANAKSKKREFKKISKSFGVAEPIAERIILQLQSFDDSFRTSEAHGVSSLRKWNLSMQSSEEDPTTELLGYWNWLNGTTKIIGELFKDK